MLALMVFLEVFLFFVEKPPPIMVSVLPSLFEEKVENI